MNTFRTYALSKKTDELKKLILENPDLPIVVLSGEDANCGDHYWMFCSDISFYITEILDCDFYNYDDTVFCDRDDLEDRIAALICDEYDDKSYEEFNEAVKNKIAEFEPYWNKVIAIYATN